MKKHTHISARRAVVLMMTVALFCPTGSSRARADKPDGKLPPIYDTKAVGAKQIEEALAIAKRDNKRVLLQFGANWCSWCHRLHDLFEKDPAIAKQLLYEYVLVLIDVDEVDGKKHNADIVKRYDNPLVRGIPVLVVLDDDGKKLITQLTEPFEVGDHHDAAKVLAFLEEWKPAPQSADKVLSDAINTAAGQSKQVLLHYSAPWCQWCKRFDAFLQREEIAPVLAKGYVPVKLDVERMAGAKKIAERFGATNQGLPFIVILDANGKMLIDSKSDKGNVGFPVEPHEISHFMKMIKKTGQKLTADELAVVEKELKKKTD